MVELNLDMAPPAQLVGERAAARDILMRFGASSLDFYRLWPDKSYFFTEDRQSFVAYRTSLRVAISLGDAAGPEEKRGEVTLAFWRFCSRMGWRVAFLITPPDSLPMYQELGLNAEKFGEEAVVDLEKFASQTAENKRFRYYQRRFERLGYEVRRSLPPHQPAFLDELKAISDEWLSLSRRKEHGFITGQFHPSYIRETAVVTLNEPGGRVIAFVNEIPDYRAGEATIDLMRHRADVPNGAMEYLLAQVLLTSRRLGHGRLSLGLAPFAGVGNYAGAPMREKIYHQVFEHDGRSFSYKGLWRFKAKFEPVWEPRFLIYQGGWLGLARTMLAVRRVLFGNGHGADTTKVSSWKGQPNFSEPDSPPLDVVRVKEGSVSEI